MELGKINLDEDGLGSSRRFDRADSSEGSDAFYHDLPRLVLIVLMLLAALLGWYVKSQAEKPEKVIVRAAETMLKTTFAASLEGTQGLKSILLARYRTHQVYRPGKGIENANPDQSQQGDEAPFDALSAIEALKSAKDIVEHDREDMYGHGTRHFSGTVASPPDSSVSPLTFDVWIGIKTHRIHRIILKRSEPSTAFDDKGHAVPKTTWINIWYRD